MSQIKELLTKEMQDLLDAETQLTQALPKMAKAAQHPKLREAFEKHLAQTKVHADRLRQALASLGAGENGEPCKGMAGLIEEGSAVIEQSGQKEALAADLALIAAAQKVEHYEIAAYGTARSLARQMNAMDCALLLSHTLGEEETTDFMLTAIADPLLQQLALDDAGGSVNLDKGETHPTARKRKTAKQERDAA